MSKKGGAESFTEAGSEASLEAAREAQQLFAETDPYRQSVYNMWNQILSGNMATGFEEAYGAAKLPIEEQYQEAEKNILETIPTGGLLSEELANLELSRTQSLEQMIADYVTNQLAQMYGTAFGVPTLSFNVMTDVGEQAVETAQAVAGGASSLGGTCCFNFLEAEGEIYKTVRQYRDEHFPIDSYVAKGYRRSARILVSLMRRFRLFKQLIRFTMTKPLKSYSQWFYGENRHGFIFWPIVKIWVNSWRLLGMGVR